MVKSYLTEKIFGREMEGDISTPKQIINADEIKKVVFKKGDILILRYKQVLSTDARKRLEEACETVLDKVGLKDDVAIMVLEQGLDVSVLTQEETEEDETYRIYKEGGP